MRFAPASVVTDSRPDGFVLRSPQALRTYARRVTDWLDLWAVQRGGQPFLAERSGGVGEWRVVTYGDARATVRRLGALLLTMGASKTRPVMLLSDNGIDHALVQLAAMYVGVPAAPVSPAYSLVSRDFEKLKAIVETVGPGVAFASSLDPFGPAIEAALGRVPLLARTAPRVAPAGGVTLLSAVHEIALGPALDRAHDAVGPDSVAKILFTSGSSGAPKGVVNTHRMLGSNQQAIAQLWPFLVDDDSPQVVVDWLPWSHTFGGNHNFNMMLANGGTLYIDGGKPLPGRFDETVANLRDVSPTLYFNVPRGYDRLASALEADTELATRFFSRLRLLFYAAAALPQSVWERLEQLAAKYRPGVHVPFVSAWGATETSPLVTQVHFPIERAGVIGLPAPGCEVRFASLGDSSGKLEMRVKGPNVTPGYWTRGGGLMPAVLDDEGYFPTGDAGRLFDETHPERGVVFDGRTAENFKLSNGTWVAVGELRARVVSACAPYVEDAVIAGQDRDYLGVLLFVSGAPDAEWLPSALRDALRAHNDAHPRATTRVLRAMILETPPSIDAGEITDKGYINQRAVLDARGAFVDALFAEEVGDRVIVVSNE